jgi:hypothetical protein
MSLALPTFKFLKVLNINEIGFTNFIYFSSKSSERKLIL